MTEQDSFSDEQSDDLKAEQAARFTVDGNRVEIETDFGRINITNHGSYVEVYISKSDQTRETGLIHEASNIFRIVPVIIHEGDNDYTRTDPTEGP